MSTTEGVRDSVCTKESVEDEEVKAVECGVGVSGKGSECKTEKRREKQRKQSRKEKIELPVRSNYSLENTRNYRLGYPVSPLINVTDIVGNLSLSLSLSLFCDTI